MRKPQAAEGSQRAAESCPASSLSHKPSAFSRGVLEVQRVLIVEDELHLADGLRFNLEAEGFHADVLDTGEAALERLLGTGPSFDLVVLDVMLPGKDGFAVVAELRAAKQFVPVLMLTARSRPE